MCTTRSLSIPYHTATQLLCCGKQALPELMGCTLFLAITLSQYPRPLNLLAQHSTSTAELRSGLRPWGTHLLSAEIILLNKAQRNY